MAAAREELSLQARLTRARRPTRRTPLGRRRGAGGHRARLGARGRGVLMLGSHRMEFETE